MYQPFFQPNVLPAQQVIQVNGKASVDALRMAPNSSVLVLDTTAPLVWLCVTDGIGNVTASPYEIKPHIEERPEDAFEKRLAAIEQKLMEVLNGKPDDASADAE